MRYKVTLTKKEMVVMVNLDDFETSHDSLNCDRFELFGLDGKYGRRSDKFLEKAIAKARFEVKNFMEDLLIYAQMNPNKTFRVILREGVQDDD